MLFAAKFSQALFAAIDHMNHSEHRHNALPVCVFPFLLVVGMPTDRNRASGHVPGSLWNLSIRPTRSPPPDLQLLHFHPPFLFAVLSITVSSPTHLLLRFFTEFQVLFSLLFTNIPSTSSPFLLFHLFISISFFYFSLFHPFSSYRSADLISHIF